jgi:ligand-binding sensor domain-containing protein
MVGALIAAPDDGLWIGYKYGGFSLLKGGRLTHFGVGAGGAVQQFAWDRDGTLWAVTSGGGLQHFKGGVWEREASDSISNGRAVVVDAAGNLWVGTGDRILVRRRGEAQFREVAKISSTYGVIRYPSPHTPRRALRGADLRRIALRHGPIQPRGRAHGRLRGLYVSRP